MNSDCEAKGLHALAERFTHFASREAARYSPLYAQLAAAVAGDDEILALCAPASEGQPAPNLLFGAVHFLLLSGEATELARFYPTLTDRPDPTGEVYPSFRRFCLEHREVIQILVTTRRVQTNEVGRCAYLYPAFATIAELSGRSLALIEVGTSAGLNLSWDRYGYRYDGATIYGNHDSAVIISAELRGDRRPPLPLEPPPVASRVGVDLRVVDVTDPEEALWLRALIWPEHLDRVRLLRAAIEVARVQPPRLLTGDGIDLLPALLEEVPPDALPCVFHTHALYQFPQDLARLNRVLAEYGAAHELSYLAVEGGSSPEAIAELTMWRDGTPHHRVLALCHGHGRWLEWLI